MGVKAHKAENDNRNDGGKISKCKAINDIGSRSSSAGICELFNWIERIAGHDFSDIANNKSSN